MAVQYAPMKLKVPPGFQNLLESLAREVLREQPDDIIKFAARYFKNILGIREEDGRDDVKKGDDMEKLYRGETLVPDPADPATAEAATTIQAAYRGHKTRVEMKEQKEHAAATKIQSSFRGHKSREEVKIIRSQMSVTADAAQEKSSETENYSDPKYTEAIVKIQAGYRGMKVREEVQANRSSLAGDFKIEADEKERTDQIPSQVAAISTDESKIKGSSQTELVDSSSIEEAATTIQAGYRGYKDRQKVQNMRQSLSTGSQSTSEEAATTIQAGYRGYKDRQKVKNMRQSLNSDNQSTSEDNHTVKETVSSNDEDTDKAATDI